MTVSGKVSDGESPLGQICWHGLWSREFLTFNSSSTFRKPLFYDNNLIELFMFRVHIEIQKTQVFAQVGFDFQTDVFT